MPVKVKGFMALVIVQYSAAEWRAMAAFALSSPCRSGQKLLTGITQEWGAPWVSPLPPAPSHRSSAPSPYLEAINCLVCTPLPGATPQRILLTGSWYVLSSDERAYLNRNLNIAALPGTGGKCVSRCFVMSKSRPEFPSRFLEFQLWGPHFSAR